MSHNEIYGFRILMIENDNFGQISKFWSKIEMLVKKQNKILAKIG